MQIFRHNLWANLRLLETCARLGEEQLDASAPGTYGRVRDTLVHILGGEEWYVSLLTGKRPEHPLRGSGDFPGFDELNKRARSSGEGLIKVAERFRPKVLRGPPEDPFAIPAVVVLLQAINHATEHRAHVVTILSQQGVKVPPLDGWAYGEELSKPAT